MKYIFTCFYGSVDVTTELSRGISKKQLERHIVNKLHPQQQLAGYWFVPVSLNYDLENWLSQLSDKNQIQCMQHGSIIWIKTINFE